MTDNASVRHAVYTALVKQQKQKAYSNLIFKDELRNYDFSAADRAFFKQLFYGVLEKRLLLDYYIEKHSSIKPQKLSLQVKTILRIGVYQLLFLDRVPDFAACNESVKLAKRYASSAAGFINGVLRGILRGKDNLAFPDPSPSLQYRLSIKHSVCQSIVSLLIKQYGPEETDGILSAMDNPQPHWLLINPLKTDRDSFFSLAKEKGMDILETQGLGMRFHYGGDVESLSLYKKGLFHLQGKASQLCCQAMSPLPGNSVLDLCAAPGGKSFTLAALMENRGSIHALDIHSHRVSLISAGASRLGYNIISPKKADSTKPLPFFNGTADRVLCDVPCSAIGLMARRPELRYSNMGDLSSLLSLQYDILQNGSRYLSPNGKLIYSTCTLNSRENQEQTDRFIAENPRFRYGKLPDFLINRSGAASHGGYVTLFPHKDGTDGFFISVLELL